MEQADHTEHRSAGRPKGSLLSNIRGGVLVEAAFALPLLVSMLSAMLAYGSWFMTAHSLQQAANEAARAAVAGLDATERRMLVEQSVATNAGSDILPGAAPVTIATAEDAGYYRVTLRHDLATVPIFAASPFPLPDTMLERSAIVRIGG